MSAWLLKKKSGSSMVRMRQYNKRYFTIDFDSRVFFYAHAEGSKKVSSVIRFADIVDVRLPDPAAVGANATPAPENTSEKRGSFIRRSFSLRSGGDPKEVTKSKEMAEQAHHFVTLIVKDSKSVELLCSSASEAQQWHQAFKEAMLFSKDSSGEGDATAPFASPSDDEAEAFQTVALAPPVNQGSAVPSVAQTLDRVPAVATVNAAIAAATAVTGPESLASGYPKASSAKAAEPNTVPPLSREPPAAPAPPANASLKEAPQPSQQQAPAKAPAKEVPAMLSQQPQEGVGTADGSPKGPAADKTPAVAPAPVEDTAPPPEAPGTFLDLSLEPAVPEATPGEATGAKAGYADAAPADVVKEAVVETGGLLQRDDFGFEAGEETDSSASAISTPREGAADTFAGLGTPGARPAGLDAPALGIGASPPSGTRFGDRDHGLSMQERLANLDFSDDEEYDDDDPLGLKKK
jgi:hypothetical protein